MPERFRLSSLSVILNQVGKWHWGDRHLNSAAQALLWHEVIPVRLSWVVSSDPQLPYLRQLTVEWDRERGRERKTASLRIDSELSIKARKEQREERYKVGGESNSRERDKEKSGKRSEQEDWTMQRESWRDHFRGLNVLFLHTAISNVGYSPTGETNCLLI